MGFGVWGLGFGVWGLGVGVWGLGVGVWGLGFGVGVWGLVQLLMFPEERLFRGSGSSSGLFYIVDLVQAAWPGG